MKKTLAKKELQNVGRYYPGSGIHELAGLCRQLIDWEFDRAIDVSHYRSGSFSASICYGITDRYEVIACSKLNPMVIDFWKDHKN